MRCEFQFSLISLNTCYMLWLHLPFLSNAKLFFSYLIRYCSENCSSTDTVVLNSSPVERPAAVSVLPKQKCNTTIMCLAKSTYSEDIFVFKFLYVKFFYFTTLRCRWLYVLWCYICNTKYATTETTNAWHLSKLVFFVPACFCQVQKYRTHFYSTNKWSKGSYIFVMLCKASDPTQVTQSSVSNNNKSKKARIALVCQRDQFESYY